MSGELFGEDWIYTVTPAAALLAGAISSFHCAGMCGPLACAFIGGGGREARRALPLYHMARLLSYILLGALAGALGHLILRQFAVAPVLLLPWALALLFLLYGLGAERWVPVPGPIASAASHLKMKSMQYKPAGRAALLGAMTPLLPCGPLYLVLGAAMFAGSAAGGAQLLACFGLGTAGVYWLLQTGFFRLQHRLAPVWIERSRRMLGLGAALILFLRAPINDGSMLPFLTEALCH